MPVAGAAGAGGVDAGMGGRAWAGVACGIIPGAGGAGMALTGAGVPMSIALHIFAVAIRYRLVDQIDHLLIGGALLCLDQQLTHQEHIRHDVFLPLLSSKYDFR